MDKINELVSDNSGGVSSIRVIMLLWTAAILFVWVYSSFIKSEIQALPNEMVTLYLGVIGLKTVQRFGEKG